MKSHKHVKYNILKNICPIHILKIRWPPCIKNRCPLHKKNNIYIYIYMYMYIYIYMYMYIYIYIYGIHRI